MIISRTPFRISFFGGGTDYPEWYREHGGAVLATTIDKYCYISLRELPPFFDHKYRLVYSAVENVTRLEDIDHPAARNVLQWMHVTCGLEIHHDGDLPARSGLGSSSSFTVGLIHAVHAFNAREASKAGLAAEAIEVEQQVIREPVGSQDQILAAYGGFNHITFETNGAYGVDAVQVPQARVEELQRHLMLFFTGISRTAPEIAVTKIRNMKHRVTELKAMQAMVPAALALLASSRSLTEFGVMLDESWRYKRQLSDRVSTTFIDEMYETAKGAGAIGGKILGAGGGGFMLLFVEPERQAGVRVALQKFIHVPFRFEDTGSRVFLI